MWLRVGSAVGTMAAYGSIHFRRDLAHGDRGMRRHLLVLAVVGSSSFLGGAVCHWLVVSGHSSGIQASRSADAGHGASVLVHEGRGAFTYANAFRVSGTAEEVLLDLGMNLTDASPGADGSRTQYTPAAWLVLSPFTAKRLAATLADAVHNYEARFGPIELDTSKRLRNRLEQGSRK